jgi:hypothetical protein
LFDAVTAKYMTGSIYCIQNKFDMVTQLAAAENLDVLD